MTGTSNTPSEKRGKIAIIAITKEGRRTAEILGRAFRHSEQFFPNPKLPLKNLIAKLFDKDKFDGLIFIMSLGIVVRVIARHLKDKYRDPAVVVVDEARRFAISALSGHEGGANQLAMQVGSILGAEPVITTASEARKNIIIGLGCRRGIKKDEVVKAIRYALRKSDCTLAQARCVATIDLKMNELGLKAASSELGLPVRIISSDMVRYFKGSYRRSSFVKEKIGVEGVCEPCALLAGRRPRLILPKMKLGGVAVAIAQER